VNVYLAQTYESLTAGKTVEQLLLAPGCQLSGRWPLRGTEDNDFPY
jgi:hypothetical protein